MHYIDTWPQQEAEEVAKGPWRFIRAIKWPTRDDESYVFRNRKWDIEYWIPKEVFWGDDELSQALRTGAYL